MKNFSRKVSTVSDIVSLNLQTAYYTFLRKYIRNKVVLDVGCWSGVFANYATKYAKKVVGVDPSKEAIKLARTQTPKVSFKVGSVERLPFKNSMFDTVVFFMVLEHIPKGTELLALREINRVLRPYGYLILDTPNKHLLSILLDPAFFFLGHRHYSKDQLSGLLTQSGFFIENMHTRGGILHQITSLFELVAKHIFRITLVYPKWLQNLIHKDYEKQGYVSNRVIAKKTGGVDEYTKYGYPKYTFRKK